MRLSKTDLPLEEIHTIEARLSKLNLLYQQLRISKPRNTEIIRSLPASVIEALYKLLDPESPSNPFKTLAAKWRVFVIFVLLLHQGLRRGELLLLPADAVKAGFDSNLGKTRYWLSIMENPFNDAEQSDFAAYNSIKNNNLSDCISLAIILDAKGHGKFWKNYMEKNII